MRANLVPLFFRGLKTDFWDNYKATETKVDARIGKIMRLAVPSDKSSEVFGYMQSAPVARFWDDGTAIPKDGVLSNAFTVRPWRFGVGVEVNQIAIEDDQSHMAMSRVLEASASFAMLPERHFYWLFTGGLTSDALQMQPFLPNAPDGAGWFSTTDGGGNNRFGVVNGNIQPTSGVGSPAAIINDLLASLSRIASYKNTQGQPYWNPGELMREVAIVYNSANNPNFISAINQTFIIAASGNAAPSNALIDIGMVQKITPIANPRITNNNWAVGAVDSPTKAPFWLERVPPREVVGEPGNSDIAREFDTFTLYVRSRGGIGLNLPIQWAGVR